MKKNNAVIVFEQEGNVTRMYEVGKVTDTMRNMVIRNVLSKKGVF